MAKDTIISSINIDNGADNGKVPIYNSTTKIFDMGTAGGVPTQITVANEATDTTCFPLFVTAATGDLAPKSNAGLAFNSNTGRLTLTSLDTRTIFDNNPITIDCNGGTVIFDDTVTTFATAIYLSELGKTIRIKEGSNAVAGLATLSSGTVTVSTIRASATSRIQLTIQSLGTVSVPKAIAVTAKVTDTSFTITSADATDTSVVYWQIFESA